MYFILKRNKNQYHFIDGNVIDSFVIDKKSLNITGNISFLKIGNKWLFRNESNLKVHYGFHRIKTSNHIYTIKYKRKVVIGEISITLIKTLPYKPIISKRGMRFTKDLSMNTSFTIGRSPGCDLVLDNPQIDIHNTKIIYDEKDCYIEDLNSSNGMKINGKKMKSKKLEDGDLITIPTASFMYYNHKLLWATPKDGVRIDIHHVSKTVTDNWSNKPIKILNDISFSILEGEYVAIVGGSGAGKSTLLDAITARRKATSGSIFYDLNSYYTFANCYQKVIGYVPQKDIMHEDLTVKKTLYYYAFIKMKHNLTKQELNETIDKVLTDVRLLDKKNLKVNKLSGGQKKRVSIAMELMSNPKVLFLDEPTSGLSPDLDYEIMDLLYELSRKGRTIVVITHNMENVDRCDKIAFLGVGGRLCFYGSPVKATTFFKSKKFGPIFSKLSIIENSKMYEQKYKQSLDYRKMMQEQEKYFKEESL